MNPVQALVIWALIVGVGTVVGSHKGRLWEGFAWTFVLGIIGLVVIACRKPSEAVQVEPGQLHSPAVNVAAGALMPVQAAVGIHDRVTGKAPKLYWDAERQAYLTKDGRTMAQVRDSNEARA